MYSVCYSMNMNTHTWHCHNMWTAPKSEKLSGASKKPSGCTLHNCCSVAWGNWYRVSCFFVLADLYELQGLKLQVQQDNHHTILRPFGPSRPSWPSKVLKRLMFSRSSCRPLSVLVLLLITIGLMVSPLTGELHHKAQNVIYFQMWCGGEKEGPYKYNRGKENQFICIIIQSVNLFD